MILRTAPAAVIVILILCKYLLQEQIYSCEAAFLSTSAEAVPRADSSNDEDSEKCPICLHTFSTHEVGKLVSNSGQRMLIPVQ
jgi:hypothetical protein